MMRRLSIALGTAILATAVSGSLAMIPAPATAATFTGTISGVVTHSKTKERIADALVVLQCSCLQGTKETQTNSNGLYAFRDLPPGTYTIQVLSGQADVSKIATLPLNSKFRANFSVDPDNEFRRMVQVKAQPVEMTTSTGLHMDVLNMPSAGVTRTLSTRRTEPRLSAKERLANHRHDTVSERDMMSLKETQAPASSLPPDAPQVDKAIATNPISKDFARQVVYSGAMQLSVFDLAKTKEQVEALVVDAGGYVQSLKAQTMVLRVPARRFRSVSTALGKLGRVDRQEFEALDVTEEFYDLKTRIEVLRRTQTQLLSLLDKARTVSQALEVRRELDKVTLELESALGKQRVLAAQVQFSALSLALDERIPQIDVPSTNDPFPWVDEIGVEGTAWR
ncbi:MAG: DUF4349 domain-containing protein [Myxococcota bacterium]